MVEDSGRFGRFSTADWIVAGTALFIICNGASICIGWWVRIPILVQLPPDTPTDFNTALTFILLGVGELGLVLRRRRVVKASWKQRRCWILIGGWSNFRLDDLGAHLGAQVARSGRCVTTHPRTTCKGSRQ